MALDRTDAELMLAFAAGELEAFTMLVDRYQKPLVNFFYAQCRDLQTAEDCAQDVFLKLYHYAARYQQQAKFSTFLFRVAKNYWIDIYRSRKSRPTQISMDRPVGTDEAGSLSDVLPGKASPPEGTLEQDELRDLLNQAVGQLPEEHQMVVILSEQQGMKYQEIAAVLDIPVGTVKSRMHSAMRKLREILKDTELCPTTEGEAEVS
jgi:RNA polymerase sigma-70 factor (ECF subfamily)